MPLGQYNLAQFNRLQSAGMEHEASYRMYAALTISLSMGFEYNASYRYEASLTGDMNLIYSYSESYSMSADLTGSMSAHENILWGGKLESAITAVMSLGIPTIYAMSADLTGSMYIPPEVWFAANLYAALTANFNSLQVSETEMRFDGVTIPVGSTLVIDSDTFSVLLDGENIIDQYDGEWIFFDRRLSGVDVSTNGVSDLTVSILYRERYL